VIVVSGASGVIGHHVIAELRRRSLGQVAILARRPGVECHQELPRLNIDILGSMEEPVSLVHLASPRSQQFDAVIRDEILSLVRLLAMPSICRVVLASTQAVYGPPTTEERGNLVSEESRLDPTCWYDIGKAVNEFQLRIRRKEDRSFRWIALRFGLLLDAQGLSGGPRAQLLPEIIEHYLNSGMFYIRSDLSIDRSGSAYSSAPGLAHAFCECLEIDYDGPMNFASGFFTWRELLESIRRVTGEPYRIVRRWQDGAYALAGGRTELDCALARRHLSSIAEPCLDDIVAAAIHARHPRSPHDLFQ